MTTNLQHLENSTFFVNRLKTMSLGSLGTIGVFETTKAAGATLAPVAAPYLIAIGLLYVAAGATASLYDSKSTLIGASLLAASAVTYPVSLVAINTTFMVSALAWAALSKKDTTDELFPVRQIASGSDAELYKLRLDGKVFLPTFKRAELVKGFVHKRFSTAPPKTIEQMQFVKEYIVNLRDIEDAQLLIMAMCDVENTTDTQRIHILLLAFDVIDVNWYFTKEQTATILRCFSDKPEACGAIARATMQNAHFDDLTDFRTFYNSHVRPILKKLDNDEQVFTEMTYDRRVEELALQTM